jgi:glycosyltransferase involved in cell wall biosynthesis
VFELSPDDLTSPISPSDVSVVICVYTLDRWTDILAAVSSVLTQRAGVREVIVVVDHNPALLQRLTAEYPALTVIANSHSQGLSGARDTGVAHASGRVVAFLDDDARADPNWSVELSAAYGDPKVVGVGGWIEPYWSVPRPPWWPSEFDWVVGCSYRGLPSHRSAVRNVIGANMSFRRSVLERAGGFDARMGRVGNGTTGGEETEVCIRVRERFPDTEIVFEPRARVFHRVSPQRAHWSYFVKRCWGEGQSKAQLAALATRQAALATERDYVLRVLPGGFLRGTFSRFPPRGAAVAVGLLVTAVGYWSGRIRT